MKAIKETYDKNDVKDITRRKQGKIHTDITDREGDSTVEKR